MLLLLPGSDCLLNRGMASRNPRSIPEERYIIPWGRKNGHCVSAGSALSCGPEVKGEFVNRWFRLDFLP